MKKIYAVLAAAAISIAALLASGTPAKAAGSYLYLNNHTGWCITALNYNVGSQVALGQCAGAATQEFWSTAQSTSFMIVSGATGLCLTYAYPNGSPDGGVITQGNCVGAQNQTWRFQNTGKGGGYVYYLPGRVDNHGNYIALNDKNDVLAVYNPINGSYASDGQDSESWSEIYYQ